MAALLTARGGGRLLLKAGAHRRHPSAQPDTVVQLRGVPVSVSSALSALTTKLSRTSRGCSVDRRSMPSLPRHKQPCDARQGRLVIQGRRQNLARLYKEPLQIFKRTTVRRVAHNAVLRLVLASVAHGDRVMVGCVGSGLCYYRFVRRPAVTSRFVSILYLEIARLPAWSAAGPIVTNARSETGLRRIHDTAAMPRVWTWLSRSMPSRMD